MSKHKLEGGSSNPKDPKVSKLNFNSPENVETPTKLSASKKKKSTGNGKYCMSWNTILRFSWANLRIIVAHDPGLRSWNICGAYDLGLSLKFGVFTLVIWMRYDGTGDSYDMVDSAYTWDAQPIT